MRFIVYTDQVYKRSEGDIRTDRTFPLFVAEVGKHLEHLVIMGRVRTDPGPAPFRMPDGVEFVGLPHYDSLVDLRSALRVTVASVRAFWQALDEADGAWVLGPHPLGVLFALLAVARRRRLVLGVRQEFRSYARRRHPRRHLVHLAADLLEQCWRLLSRANSAIVVGPALNRQYRHAGRLHNLYVSMIRASQIVGPEVERTKSYGGPLTILSVGRLDEEKNPLMLADVLAGLRANGRDWRLVICGKGQCENQLIQRLEALGVSAAAQLKGYVPIDGGLRNLYIGAHVFLHVSWTEGVPQVLFEAFSTHLPVVATDVGGVATAAGNAALLIPPDNVGAAVRAVELIADDQTLRQTLTAAGARRASEHTLEAEAARVAEFLTS